jgi:hypothetical protein
MYVFRNGVSFSTREGSIFLYRRYVCCTAVSARVYPRSHGVRVTTDSATFATALYQHVHKVYKGFLSMKTNFSRSSFLYVLGTDRTENTASSSSTVACDPLPRHLCIQPLPRKRLCNHVMSCHEYWTRFLSQFQPQYILAAYCPPSSLS